MDAKNIFEQCNDNDLKMINHILSIREALSNRPEPGNFSFEYFNFLSNRELNDIICEHKRQIFLKRQERISEILDIIFSKYASKDENVIILGTCYREFYDNDEYSDTIIYNSNQILNSLSDYDFEHIMFEDTTKEFKKIKPVGFYCSDGTGPWDVHWPQEFIDLYNELIKLSTNENEDLFVDNENLNYYVHGVLVIDREKYAYKKYLIQIDV